ncbi:protein FAR1-RELATED SEQUENCE 5-like [Helianthus annuus]|uniref:protein FAR1-RELATED SEQUENCE 5-like n=1 Tax=Helianthus annuus TaxID=4232 RepID=UPI000B906FC5|nr:protein FAR1-RELATED SEQUENCE 5-like [Helianthus annuus]
MSPNGTKYWVPNVVPGCKPALFAEFDTWEDVVRMYQEYAENAGFDTRLSTIRRYNGQITHRYIVCNKEGKTRGKSVDSIVIESTPVKQHGSSVKVTDCKACIKLKRKVDGKERYMIYKFVEAHNHKLVSFENMDLMRSRRQLGFVDEEFIHNMQANGFGATVSHRTQATLKRGHYLVAGTRTDYKNCSRDFRCFIGDKDAQLLVDKMDNRVKHLNNCSYDKIVVNGELRSILWVDHVSKCNYKVFGDVLAFDATYSTNMYNMIFVPFTGVDHHKKMCHFWCWVHDKQPRLVLTDQEDPAMKQVVSLVLTEATHRLCMWHVTKKIPAKIFGSLLKNTNIRAHLHKLVWSVFIKPSTFEKKWRDMLDEFDLHGNTWLTDMYEIREQCEGNMLVQFMLCYETALDAQRYNQQVLEHASSNTTPTFRTHLAIERHATQIYTRTIFDEVQNEIFKGLYFCSQESVEYKDSQEVTINLVDNTMTCSCMGFIRLGYLCRHVFCVYKNMNIEQIPELYQVTRWMIDALPSNVFSIENRYGVAVDELTKLRQDATASFEACVNRLWRDMERLSEFADEMKNLKNKIYEEVPIQPAYNSKEVVMANLAGVVSSSKEVTLTAPQGIRNKGSGTKHRLIGPGEKAMEKSKKKKTTRFCNTCLMYVDDHDSRNCPDKINPTTDQDSGNCSTKNPPTNHRQTRRRSTRKKSTI